MNANTRSQSSAWLYGPWTDLMLGTGVIYAIMFVLLIFFGTQIHALLPMQLAGLLVLFTGLPHYGATLLRVYERREERQRYYVFAVWSTVIMVGLFAGSVYSVVLGSWMLTVYLTWSPWHYAGQNYGIAMMLFRRAGVEVTSRARLALRTSFVLSFSLVALALHGTGQQSGYVPLDVSGNAYHFQAIGLPQWFVVPMIPTVTIAYVACLAYAAWELRKTSSWRTLFPGASLVGTQALWFSVPMLARHTETFQGIYPLDVKNGTYVFLWIAITHSIQYLWVSAYFQSRSPTAKDLPTYYRRAMLAGAALWVVPAVLFSPSLLGRVPYDAGLSLLVASAANLHHFILDGAIWKLRDGKLARILLRGQTEKSESVAEVPSFVPKLIWAAGAVSVFIWAAAPLASEYGMRRAAARGDYDQMVRSSRWLRAMGQGSAQVELDIAAIRQAAGRTPEALEHVAEATKLDPSMTTWARICELHARGQRLSEAVAACRNAAESGEAPTAVKHMLGFVLLRDPASGAAARTEAIALLEQAVLESDRNVPRFMASLATGYASVGRWAEAVQEGRAALDHLKARPDPAEPNLASELERLISEWSFRAEPRGPEAS